MKAYAFAMGDRLRTVRVDNQKFAKDFSVFQIKSNADAAKRQEEDRQKIRTIALSAASLAAQVPVVGQFVALAITVGIAITEALYAAGVIPPPPTRDPAAPPIYKIAGKFTRHALVPNITGYSENGIPFRQSAEDFEAATDLDPYARLLPELPSNEMYEAVPFLEDFQSAVRVLFPGAYREIRLRIGPGAGPQGEDVFRQGPRVSVGDRVYAVARETEGGAVVVLAAPDPNEAPPTPPTLPVPEVPVAAARIRVGEPDPTASPEPPNPYRPYW